MSKVHGDAESIDGFATQLKGFADQVRDSMGKLNGAMGQLSGSWKDDQFNQFEAAFRQDAEHLRAFAEEADRVVAALRVDAGKLRQVRGVGLK